MCSVLGMPSKYTKTIAISQTPLTDNKNISGFDSYSPTSIHLSYLLTFPEFPKKKAEMITCF